MNFFIEAASIKADKCILECAMVCAKEAFDERQNAILNFDSFFEAEEHPKDNEKKKNIFIRTWEAIKEFIKSMKTKIVNFFTKNKLSKEETIEISKVEYDNLKDIEKLNAEAENLANDCKPEKVSKFKAHINEFKERRAKRKEERKAKREAKAAKKASLKTITDSMDNYIILCDKTRKKVIAKEFVEEVNQASVEYMKAVKELAGEASTAYIDILQSHMDGLTSFNTKEMIDSAMGISNTTEMIRSGMDDVNKRINLTEAQLKYNGKVSAAEINARDKLAYRGMLKS